MISTSKKTLDIPSYISNLSVDEKQAFLKQLGKEIDTKDISVIRKSNQIKRKQEGLNKSLQKYRKSWKILRCNQEDLEEEWINDWWKSNRMTNKNKIQIGYEDIIIDCEGLNNWTAIAGTDCEWFESQESLQDMINEVKYHNSSGLGEWGAGTVGGSHEYVNRVFIGLDSVKYFEGETQLEILKNRYTQVYILDYNNPF